MQIQIADEQKTIGINLRKTEELARRILRILRVTSKSSLGITFISREKIKRLNRRYFRKDGVTDVIVFGYKGALGRGDIYTDYLGDIVICPSVALENSRIYRNDFLKELTLYLIHGILHLKGYSDRSRNERLRLRRKEKALLKRII